MITEHTIRAIVVKDGQIGMASGDRSKSWDIVPAGLLTDAGSLLGWAARHLPMDATGVLLVPSLPAYGDDGWSLDQRAEIADQRAAEQGWTRPPAQRWQETGWITWQNQATGQAISMGLLDLMDQARTPVANLEGTAVQVAYELAQYDAMTGTPWRMTAGVTGTVMLRGMITASAEAKRQRMPFGGVKVAAPALPRWHSDVVRRALTCPTTGVQRWARAAGDVRWARDLADGERHGHVHHLDVTAMYLAAAAAAVLPWGELRERDPHTFDESAAGYWLVDCSDLPTGPAAPPLWDRHAVNPDGTVYLTTPVMELLKDHGYNPMVRGALLAPTQGRFLRSWAEHLRDALADDRRRESTRRALKATYTQAIGMMNVPGGSIYRPEWRDLIIDQARANLLRKVYTARHLLGIWPVRIHVDSVWYPHPEQDPTEVAAAVGGSLYGRQIGRFRLVKSTPAADYTHPSTRKAEA